MTGEELDAIEAREKAATPGPWGYDSAYGDCENEGNCPHGYTGHQQGGETECESCRHWYMENSATFCGPTFLEDGEDGGMCTVDAMFVAHSRKDVPALISEVKRLKAEAERLTIERNAAVADLLAHIITNGDGCKYCKHDNSGESYECANCDRYDDRFYDQWEWRGVRE